MNTRLNVLDLFSGAGGMSFGFHAHCDFRVIGAVDAQNGKPSAGQGTLECNRTYLENIGVTPLAADLGHISERALRGYVNREGETSIDVLISCAPCTGFSRTIRQNMVVDDPRNALVSCSWQFVQWLSPKIFLMENVGELLQGKFTHHYAHLRAKLEWLGYDVSATVHKLEDFGLPQVRRRALIIAVKRPLGLRTLDELWRGYRIRPEAVTVRRAIGKLAPIEAGESHLSDPWHASPAFTDAGLRRLKLIPPNGGSWPDLLKRRGGENHLIPSMLRYVGQGRVGPHPDVYGRMAWDMPAVTIKRECSHTGNGRYAHPEQHRLCSVREMAILQGFPRDYRFIADSMSNMYRHIGDAVPPLISHQLAHVCSWIIKGRRPDMRDVILPRTHLTSSDVEVTVPEPTQMKLAIA